MALETLKDVAKVIGIKQATKAVIHDRARLVYIAADADVRVTRSLLLACAKAKVAVDRSPIMSDLGKACSIEVGAAAVAVLKDQDR